MLKLFWLFVAYVFYAFSHPQVQFLISCDTAIRADPQQINRERTFVAFIPKARKECLNEPYHHQLVQLGNGGTWASEPGFLAWWTFPAIVL